MFEQESAPATAAPTIRATTPDDLEALRTVIDATGLFSSALLGNMAASYFSGAAPEYWLTAEADGVPIAVAYYVPERMTQGTWNLLLIAVHPNRQRQGVGVALMRHVEALLKASGERLLLVETSGLPTFAGTRAFYRRIGYDEEAIIREFYQAGEDQIVFRKVFNGAT